MKRTTRIGTGLGVGIAALAAAAVTVASPAASMAAVEGAATAQTAASAPAEGCEGRGRQPLTGDDAVQATAAAEAAVEGGTVLRVTVDPDGDYEAHVRDAEGTVVEVTMDDTFTVTGVEQLPTRGSGGGHGGPRGHGGGPDSDNADEDGANAEGTASQTTAA